MKFSDLDAAHWQENKQFYDTCLIPFTGLTGEESPPDAVAALERLRDFMDAVEKPFRGRIITYPVQQYTAEHAVQLINDICRKVKSTNFRYAIVLTADLELAAEEVVESDLVLSRPRMEVLPGSGVAAVAAEKIHELWQKEQLF